MKVSSLIAGCATVALLSGSALAWTNEDHEIFDIVSALETAEGKGTNFYSFLNVTKSASEKDISKSYRKRSLELQYVPLASNAEFPSSAFRVSRADHNSRCFTQSPDKNPDDKIIADRFARLGTIAGILRDAEKRKRYDHFYENGVPRWRDYYSRYRPGLFTVLGMLTGFSCFIQYIYFMLKWGLDIQRIRAFQNQALEHAWGPTKKPLAGRKRMKLKTGDQVSPGVPGINKGRPTKPGYVLEMVVEGDKVFVVEKGDELLIEEDAAIFPRMNETWIPTLVDNAYAKVTGRAPAAATEEDDSDDGYGAEDAPRTPSARAKAKAAKEAAAAIPKKPKGPARGTEGAGKVGGRRRAGVPKKPEA
ncbi:hypothetical protein P7C70_g1104, partial [Phenoliferia sp. Uapishka_3]